MATQPKDRVIVLSGGGTGGHITPILAVAHELKRQDPNVRTIYIGEHGGKFQELTDQHEAIDQTYTVLAGKFRRYNGESWFTRLSDIKTNILNIRDLFYFMVGTVQSVFLLHRIKPNKVFLKGGFVGVPIGIASKLRGTPFITHDSDALPGLANRLVGRWASAHAVALPTETYRYPKNKTVQVGVLVEPNFKPVSSEIQRSMKLSIGIPENSTMLLITGGSSGARNINQAMKQIAETLLQDYSDLHIVHQAGKGKSAIYGAYKHDRLTVLEFMRPMYNYTGAADIVVSRASGNTVAELGVQGKAVIVVPNPLLTGGHQLKNAEALEALHAALVVPETAKSTNADDLDKAIRQLLEHPTERIELARNLQQSTLTNAAEKLAKLLIDT